MHLRVLQSKHETREEIGKRTERLFLKNQLPFINYLINGDKIFPINIAAAAAASIFKEVEMVFMKMLCRN